MSIKISFKAEGIPAAQPRHRSAVITRKDGSVVFNDKGRPMMRQYTPDTAKGWRQALMWQAKEHHPKDLLTGPLRVDCEFIMPRPKAHFKTNGTLRDTAPFYPDHKPDKDNLEKLVFDELTRMGFWMDDGQISAGVFLRRYTRAHEAPGVAVVITTLDDPVDVQENLPLGGE